MKAFTPEIVKLKDRRVVTVTSTGDPNKVMEPYMKALYGAAYFAKMKVYKPKGDIWFVQIYLTYKSKLN